MKSVKIRITGSSPILLVCDKLADPLDKATIAHKKLTSTRGKARTEDIIIAIAKSQYTNSVYHSKETGVFVPSINVKKCLEEGAKLSRDGDKVRKGVMIFDDEIKLEYGDDLTPIQLWNSGKYLDKRSVVVGQSKIMCYRPKFAKWSLNFEVVYDTEIIEPEGINDYFNSAGAYVGLGGFRPSKNGMFGRFTSEIVK